MTINLQSIFMTRLRSEKKGGYQMKKNPVWKHYHGGACKRLFKSYHQTPLKAK